MAMVGHFRKIKNELGDPLLKFIIVSYPQINLLDMFALTHGHV